MRPQNGRFVMIYNLMPQGSCVFSALQYETHKIVVTFGVNSQVTAVLYLNE